jgi:hypothetical protein
MSTHWARCPQCRRSWPAELLIGVICPECAESAVANRGSPPESNPGIGDHGLGTLDRSPNESNRSGGTGGIAPWWFAAFRG